MSTTTAGCAAVRSALGEPVHATAPEAAASWLLLEHPGPWPVAGLPGDVPEQARAVVERAAAAGVRPQLVRRVTDRRSPAATVVLASCRPGATWLERRALPDLRALEDLDVDALAQGRAPGFGTATDEPVVLVCTHGRRDVCCARLGRPLAVLLDRQLPGQVWETNHLGGDRFAPNVVALPDGSYHGGAGLADVPALAEAVTSGRVLLPHLRGRAGRPAAEQAADRFLREETGETLLDGVRVIAVSPSDDGTCVELLAGGDHWCVHVALVPHEGERLTSCKGEGTVGTPSSWRLTALRRLG